jgi:hypothetical protein
VDVLLAEVEADEGNDEASLKYLRITMRLSPSMDGLVAPTLRDWHLVYDCLDSE